MLEQKVYMYICVPFVIVKISVFQVFGGRSWTTGPQNPTTIQEPPSTFKRTPSFGVGFRKKMTCNVSPKVSYLPPVSVETIW